VKRPKCHVRLLIVLQLLGTSSDRRSVPTLLPNLRLCHCYTTIALMDPFRRVVHKIELLPSPFLQTLQAYYLSPLLSVLVQLIINSIFAVFTSPLVSITSYYFRIFVCKSSWLHAIRMRSSAYRLSGLTSHSFVMISITITGNNGLGIVLYVDQLSYQKHCCLRLLSCL